MKYVLISVFDSKASAFKPPVAFDCIANAVRAYANVFKEARAQDSQLVRYPEDFTLFQVGEFDVISGQVEPIIPQFVEKLQVLAAQERSLRDGKAG